MKNRVQLVLLLAACCFVTLAPACSMASAELGSAEAIDGFIEDQLVRYRIPGLALGIVHGGEIVYLRGFGTAGPGRTVSAQTPFYVGSITKSFTALAVMQLAEAGQVDLDAPVQDYIPWFRVAGSTESYTITVRHLLYQTSGLSETTYLADLAPDASLEDAIRDLQNARPVDPPGAAFTYFNQNYDTLGLLVETVSGQAYGDYVQQHILDPLDMKDSSATLDCISRLDVAQGHGILFGFPLARRQSMTVAAMPSGGLVSTAEDMTHYLIAQLNGGVYNGARILSARGIAELQRPNTPGAPPGEGYGMGWIVEQHQGLQAIHHGGSLDNFRTFAWLLPEQDYGFVVLLNQNGFVPAMLAYSQIPEGIASLLTGREPASGLSMRALYALVAILFLLTVALDLRWWLVVVPRLLRYQPSVPRVRVLVGLVTALLRTGLFYALPFLLLRSMGRGFAWTMGFAMAPTVILFVGWNIIMGLTASLARSWLLLRSELRVRRLVT